MKKDDYISYKPDLKAIQEEAEEQCQQWKIEAVDPDDILGTLHNMDVYLMAAIYYLEDYIATTKQLQSERETDRKEMN